MRAVYRLGCCQAPIEAVADKIMGAVAHIFRCEGIQVVRNVYRELDDALSLVRTTRFRESASAQAFEQLASSVSALKADAEYSEIARLAERAALRTFNELENSHGLVADDLLKQHFTRNLCWELTERRCLGAAREGMMRSTGKDAHGQQTWESKLRRLILDPCASLSKALLSDEGYRLVRAPKRLFRPKPLTLESLKEPLGIRGDSL